MTEMQYLYGLSVFMLLISVPQLYAGYLCLRWRRYAVRDWVRFSFLVVAIGSLFSGFLRVFIFFTEQELWLRFFSHFIFLLGVYVVVGAFALATHMMERRITTERNKAGSGDPDIPDILHSVISELRDHGVKSPH